MTTDAAPWSAQYPRFTAGDLKALRRAAARIGHLVRYDPDSEEWQCTCGAGRPHADMTGAWHHLAGVVLDAHA